MSKNRALPALKFFLFAFFSGVVAISYNNCGQRSFDTNETSQGNRYYTTVESLESGRAHLSKTMCLDEKNFVCELKSFSVHHKNDRLEVDFPCVDIQTGHELCVSGFAHNFRSKCEKCQEKGRDSEFEEYACYYYDDQARKGLINLISRELTLEQALKSVVKDCLDLTKGERDVQ